MCTNIFERATCISFWVRNVFHAALLDLKLGVVQTKIPSQNQLHRRHRALPSLPIEHFQPSSLRQLKLESLLTHLRQRMQRNGKILYSNLANLPPVPVPSPSQGIQNQKSTMGHLSPEAIVWIFRLPVCIHLHLAGFCSRATSHVLLPTRIIVIIVISISINGVYRVKWSKTPFHTKITWQTFLSVAAKNRSC